MEQLKMLREHLAQNDEIILNALLMRNAIVEEIMAYKEENGLQILQPEQDEKRDRWLDMSLEGKRHGKEVKDIYSSIVKNAKRIQARHLFNYNIVLIGFMGAGKSTISDYLSTCFDMEVVEMDQVISEREGMSISDIFETYGEEYFRNAETNLLKEMQAKRNAVISCGGGTPLLTARPETILERVKDSHDRPLIENNKSVEFINDLMLKRREKYVAAADIIIETDDKSELDICEELVNSLLKLDNK